MLHLAHLSDLHVGPLPCPSWSELWSKRLLGLGSWHFHRRFRHKTSTLERIITDIHGQSPDHIICTGDLVNLNMAREDALGQAWLERMGPPDRVSFVPGNHDAYAPRMPEPSHPFWAPYATGTLALSELEGMAFPYVRTLRTVALIGLSSALPQPWNLACGTLGETQCEALAFLLDILKEKGFYRLVFLHHPPLSYLCRASKALTDSALLTRVLKDKGAELVLFGHTHKNSATFLPTRHGNIPILGVSSASDGTKPHPASWRLISIDRRHGEWVTQTKLRRCL